MRRIQLGFAIFAMFSTIAIGNPTVQDPTKPLATHNTVPGAAELAKAVYEASMAAEKYVVDCEQAVAKKGGVAIQAKMLAKWKATVNQGIREAERLQIMGEPAAVDILLRNHDLTVRLNYLYVAHNTTPAGQVVGRKALMQFQRQAAAKQKECEKVSAMAALQPEVAEAAADKLSMELDTLVHFVGLQERGPYLPPYYAARAAADAVMTKKRIATARQKFQEAIQANLPDPVALTSWANAAASQLKSTGKATVEGQGDVAGPQVLEELIRRWGVGHGGLQRVQGLRWALRWHSTGSNGYEDSGSVNGDDPTYSEAIAWTDTVLAAMAGLIGADAESIQPAKVAVHHQQYLKQTASMARMGDARKVQTKGNEALAVLLAKNSVYETNVKTYDAATKDLITFQTRWLKDAVSNIPQDFPNADGVVRDRSRAIGSMAGLYAEDPNAPMQATLFHPAHKTMMAIAPKLVGPKVGTSDVLRISPTSKTSAVKFMGRTYATVLAVTIPEPDLQSIKLNLLVDESHPPLSISTAKAIDSVLLGHYSAIGGTIVSAQIEAMITRFVTMSDGMAIVVPRGTVTGSSTDHSMLNQMAVRIDIDPSWVQHDLGIYRIPGK